MARTNRKHRGKFALAAPRVEVVLVPEEQPTSADQVALAAGTLFDAYLVLHVPDGEPPKTIRLDGGPFDKEGAINVSGVFPPSCSERHSSEDANQLMASVRIYGRPYS